MSRAGGLVGLAIRIPHAHPRGTGFTSYRTNICWIKRSNLPLYSSSVVFPGVSICNSFHVNLLREREEKRKKKIMNPE